MTKHANPSSRRTLWMFLKTLLWKNWILKKRHPIATFFEVALPCAFVLLLGGLRHLTDDVNVPSGWSTSQATPGNATQGTSFNLYEKTGTDLPSSEASLPKFYMHETSMTGILLGLGIHSISSGIRLNELSSDDYKSCTIGVTAQGATSTNLSSPHAIPSSCQGKVVPYKIAIAPSTGFTKDYFLATMDQWYPRISLIENIEIPSFRDSMVLYESVQALEKYVKSHEYGTSMDHPKIEAAIVFDTYPKDADIGQFQPMEYTIRMNSTLGRRGIQGVVPQTNGDPPPLRPFAKDIDIGPYASYTTSGFMTLQTLVTRFVTCMPFWNANNQTIGPCQQKQATSVSKPDVDARLLASLNDDVVLQLAMSALPNKPAQFTDILALVNSSAREALLTPLRQIPQPYLGAAVAPMPIEAYTDTPFYDQVKDVFALVFIIAYLYCTSRMLIVFIQEKESRMREYMKIVGVQEKAIIMSWYLTYGVILFLGSVIQTWVGRVGVFTHSSMLIIFLFFYLFGLSVLSFCFLISAMFSKARTGAFVGVFVFLLMYFVSSAITPQTSRSIKGLSSLLSPVALSLGAKVLANVESTGQGMQWNTLSMESEQYSFSMCLSFFLFDSFLYTILGMYFERVIPKDYGNVLPWFFPFTLSYWKRNSYQAIDHHVDDQTTVLDVNAAIEEVNLELHEQERTGDALIVQRLRKVFSIPGGEKVAVKGMNLIMYKDQITCLLGHNGAGKTTLISMLTGMTNPTSGTATFHGFSFTQDMDMIRQSLGICFQHDVLFPELTVEEHLQLFARFKACDNIDSIVSTQIEQVGLTEKRRVASSELSGGMKRKLSVALSLLGDSALVFLDEPTSGMDPYSRRKVWEILLNNRMNRIMVLTTHFMDEADLLGDRIAIMSEGELRCCGSSLFLKNRYGAGYHLTLVKDTNCQDHRVIEWIQSHVAQAIVLSNVGHELSFQLPFEAASRFANMFKELDQALMTLQIRSYGISVTTLEEVFLKVAQIEEEDEHGTIKEKPNLALETHSPIESDSLFSLHVRALFMKRFQIAKRDRRAFIVSTLLPILLLFLGLYSLYQSKLTSSNPLLAFTPQLFTQSSTPFYCQDDIKNSCETVMNPTLYTGPTLDSLSLPNPSYPTSQPKVFDVVYSAINTSDVQGYTLRLGETLLTRGKDQGIEQYGAYLVHVNPSLNLMTYNIFVNTTATHGAPIYKASFDEALYRWSSSNPQTKLQVNNHPLPLTASSKALFGSFLAFTSCLFIVISLSFFPAFVVTHLVKEKQVNAKHQQMISGVSTRAFWLANYIFDFIHYLIMGIAILILIQAFNITALTGRDCVTCTSQTFPAVVVLFLFFGLAICPFTYCLSFLFHEHASAQNHTRLINLALGLILMIVSFILDLTTSWNQYLVFLWRFSPLFCLGNGLLRLTLHELRSILESDLVKKNPFSTELVGWELIYLILTSILFGLVTLGIEYLKIRKPKSIIERQFEMNEQDVDVAQEAERVTSGRADNDVIVLKHLRKIYSSGKIAVRDVSFGLQRGECFGFLGINGAGKTTTLKMLTGDLMPTSGTALLNGMDLYTQSNEIRRQIGYCPQFDALFELLSVREHLELYASLKGIRDKESVVMEKIRQLNLEAFEFQLAGSLSGGNKRKLSVAIALIGNPPIVFLDEPSTGMDPFSRRFMWDVITDISTQRQLSTVILTTHSMEESEALCSRVGIMVGGQLRCLGSIQHLKSRFGDGLVFDMKMSPPTQVEEVINRLFDSNLHVTRENLIDKCRLYGHEDWASRIVHSHPTGYSLAMTMERDGWIRAEAFCQWCLEETQFESIFNYLKTHFEQVELLERQNDFGRFKLKGKNLLLSKVFATIEDMKTNLPIREYNLSQTTLEQIFNAFAKQQLEEQGNTRGMYQVA